MRVTNSTYGAVWCHVILVAVSQPILIGVALMCL